MQNDELYCLLKVEPGQNFYIMSNKDLICNGVCEGFNSNGLVYVIYVHSSNKIKDIKIS